MRFCQIILLIGVLAVTAFAQAEESRPFGNDNSSFSISTGSMFAASPKKSAAVNPAVVRTPAITTITNDMDEAITIIRRNYASSQKGSDGNLIDSAIESMLHQLDPHSSYFTREEFRELTNDHQGRYVGIGTTISSFARNGQIDTYVLSTAKNSPAERAGLCFGDRIVEVDGKAVTGMTSLEVRNLVRGPLGSSVRLTVERADGTIIRNISLNRNNVAHPSIEKYLMLDDRVGYITLTDGFGYTTAAEFDAAFLDLKRKGMSSLIIDLRGNGGGIMDEAIKIAENFLPFGQTIVSQRGRYVSENRVWRSQNRRSETLPLVLLVDNDTASASEILVAAMQDNDRAVVIGKRTFGKALVQSVYQLDDGSGLAITSDRYFSPSGRSLQRDYSDSGLYDYFRHTNHGALIDSPQNASRTLKGRVVFGGDGIQPDKIVDGFENDKKRSAMIDRLFENIRAGIDLSTDSKLLLVCKNSNCANDLGFLRLEAAKFEALRSGIGSPTDIKAVQLDEFVRIAMTQLRNNE
ncbi:MAG: S41 family peptidase [Pyrinomonadaceae bacterium]